jgi:hypothetical protein
VDRNRTDIQIIWARWLLGVVTAVIASNFIMASTIREHSIEACLRNTADRALEVRVLENGLRGRDPNSQGAQVLREAINEFNTRTRPTKEGQDQFCRDRFPRPFPVNLVGRDE